MDQFAVKKCETNIKSRGAGVKKNFGYLAEKSNFFLSDGTVVWAKRSAAQRNPSPARKDLGFKGLGFRPKT
jgi:hypothetical protein